MKGRDIEVGEVRFSEDVDTDTFQKPRRYTDKGWSTHLNFVRFSASEVGIFGNSFKAPREFKHLSKANLLEEQLLKFIDDIYSGKGSHSDTRDRKTKGFINLTISREMSYFPLKYKNRALEQFYGLNLSDWIISKSSFLSIITFILTIILWPMSIRTFNLTGEWRDRAHMYTIFHLVMGLSSILFLAPICVARKRFIHWSEHVSYISLGIVGFIWGCWQILGCFALKDVYSKMSTYEQIISYESVSAMAYIYGLLPIVTLDSLLPSRTSKTWWIHLQFIVLYSTSAIVSVSLQSPKGPWVYVVFRITAYVSIALILLFGSYTSELQTRVAFFNWLVTSRKVATLEKDLHGFRTTNKISTTADIALNHVKACSTLANQLSELVEEKAPELTGQFSSLHEMIQGCISHITNSQNLYSVPRGELSGKLGNEMDVINAYVTTSRDNSFGSASSLSSKHLEKFKSIRSRNFNAGFKEFMSILPYSVSLGEKLNANTLYDWNFQIISHFKNNKQAFLSIGQALLSEFQAHYSVPEDVLLKFLALVDGLYNKSVAYHNSMHAAFVAHKIYCLANYVGVYGNMSILDRAIIIVAALCHDIGHPGRNNTFFINSQHPVAQLFNDKSVLENFHSCCTFNILDLPECNIFSDVSVDEHRVIRRKLIELILATDMGDHFEIISKFSLRKNSPEFSKRNEEDIHLVSKVLIKAADLSSGGVPWVESFEWSQRLLDEFYEQGDEEIRLDLPISALCDRKRHNEVAKSQYTFLKLVVSPIFEELASLNPSMIKDVCLKQLYENAEKWREMSESDKDIPLLNLERGLHSGRINIAWAIPNRE